MEITEIPLSTILDVWC